MFKKIENCNIYLQNNFPWAQSVAVDALEKVANKNPSVDLIIESGIRTLP